MVRSDSMNGKRVSLYWYVGSLAFAWTLVTVGLVTWEWISHYGYARKIARAEAGVPFDIEALYMLRELHELGHDEGGRRTHITSLTPLRPANAPDAWEAAALRAFENGSREVSSVETIDGAPYLRRMQPLIAKASCMKCHRAENYKLGEISGGMSVSVPLSEFEEAARTAVLRQAIGHAALWVLGVGGIVFAGRRLASQVRQIRRAEEEVRRAYAGLETTVQRRTAELGKQIEDRKRVEETLRDSEMRYRVLFESAPDAVMTLAPPSWRFTSCNQATVKLFHVTNEAEFVSLGPWQLSPETQKDGRLSAEKTKEMIETAMREGSHFFEWTHKRLDGDDFPATVWLTRMELAGQALLHATVRDITVQTRVEETEACLLRQLEGVNQLREDLLLPGLLEDKFKRITKAAVEILDLDFCRIWCVKPSDLCEAGCIHADVTEGSLACRDRERCLHLISSAGRYTHVDGDHRRVPVGAHKIGRIATGQDKSFLTNHVTTDPCVQNHDWAKSLGLVSFAGYKLRDRNGEPIGVLAAFAKHPISEEVDAFLCNLAETTSKVIHDAEVHAELRERTKQALLATRAKSEFLTNMSHEIRTPMTSILGYADLLMDDSLTAADRKTFLTTVRRNGEQLLQLINDILDLSKIESGKMVMNLRPCHFPSMVADVASMMRPRAEQRGNTLEVCYAGPVPETIHTSGTRLRQVIVNLVGNAVKFTEHGSIRIGVSFLPQWRSDQSAVRVEVADTGIGIREESLSRLFEPFMQAESSTTRKYGGTGLGLAISDQIVAALGGELTVESAPGEGSTFTVTIPTGDIAGVNLLQSPGEVICEDEAGTRWTPGAGVLRGVKILFAEDSIDNQDLLRAVLGHVGAEVEVVENGRLAIERARTGDFDVVLMDMNMPEMDGYEATRRLRDCGYQRPILALTANAMTGDSERCLAAGCNAHLAKPIDRKQLIETVAQFAPSQARKTDAPTAEQDRVMTPGKSDMILSQFADDPQLAEILPGFVERLPAQLDALCEALEEERLDDIQRLAHRLKGAGGSYGYPTLSEVAKSLELAAKAQDVDGATATLAEVKEVCAAIQTGWTGHPAEIGKP
jgi:PAS domain S-box-containing protein